MSDAPKAAATTALATVAPEALLAKVAADKGTAVVKDVLTGDIAVVRVSYPRGTKRKPLPPVEVEYHVNLVGIGLGAFLLALGAIAVGIAWNGIQTFGGGLRGLKDSAPGRGGGSSPSPLDQAIADFKHILGLP